MTGYPPGSMQDLYYVAEANYGVIPTDALAWLGETQGLRNTSDPQVQFHHLPGARSFGAVTRGPYNCGCVARYLDRAGSEWHDMFALYGYGSASGLADHLGDFTLQGDIYDGTTHNYQVYSGCKVNRAEISAQKGMPLIFELDIFSQWFRTYTSKTLASGMQDVVIANNASAETGAILTWGGASQINLAAGGLATWYPQSFTLSVVQKLEREYGSKTGDDSVDYPVAIALHEGERDILFEAEVVSQNMTYANSKMAGDAITALTLVIDDETITLADGEWEANDMPEYAQAVNRERVAMRFKSLSIA